jgi:uncharacterized protein YcbX
MWDLMSLKQHPESDMYHIPSSRGHSISASNVDSDGLINDANRTLQAKNGNRISRSQDTQIRKVVMRNSRKEKKALNQDEREQSTETIYENSDAGNEDATCQFCKQARIVRNMVNQIEKFFIQYLYKEGLM